MQGKQNHHESEAREVQIGIFRAMAPEKKLQLLQRLYFSARELKAAELRHRHPDWDEDAIQEKVREIFLYART